MVHVYGFEIHIIHKFSLSLQCANIYSGIINIHSGSIFMVSLIHKITPSRIMKLFIIHKNYVPMKL